MNKKSLPFVIGIPNMGVGMLWAMNMSLIPMLVGTVTKSNVQLAILVSMGAFTGIFVQYLAGLLSDRSRFRLGRRRPFMLMGSIAASVFICVMPFSGSYILMFIFAFLFYFSLNFYQGPYYSLIPEMVSDKQLGLANGFSKIVSVLGSAVVFLLGPSLWAKGQYLPFFLAAFLSIITVVPTTLLLKEDTTKVGTTTKFSFDFLKDKPVMRLFISVFLIFFAYGCITPFFVKYCTTMLHLTDSTANMALLLLTVVGALFAAPLGILSDKTERRKVLLLGTVLFAAAMAAASFVKTALMLYVVLSVVGVGFIAIQVTIYAILAEIAPPERMGEYMGIMNLFVSLSQFIANNVMGAVLDTLGWGLFFPISAIIMVGAFFMILFSRFEREKTSDFAAERPDAAPSAKI